MNTLYYLSVVMGVFALYHKMGIPLAVTGNA